VGFAGAQTALYAGYLKKQGLVSEGRKAMGRGKGVKKPDLAQPLCSVTPTVTERISADFGVNTNSVRNRIRNAAKLAAREGVTVETKTPEAMGADDLIKIGEVRETRGRSRQRPRGQTKTIAEEHQSTSPVGSDGAGGPVEHVAVPEFSLMAKCTDHCFHCFECAGRYSLIGFAG
jgi:hypothetical protein